MIIELQNGEKVDPTLIKDLDYVSDFSQGERSYSVKVTMYDHSYISNAWFDTADDALDYIKLLKEAPHKHKADQLDDIMEVLSRTSGSFADEIYEICQRSEG